MSPEDFFKKEYRVNTEIVEVEEGLVLLREEFEYDYDDVWEARSVYEEFFQDNDWYDSKENESQKEQDPYFDSWITLTGNRFGMLVKKGYIHSFKTVEEAKQREKALRQQLKEIIEWNRSFMREDDGEGSILIDDAPFK